MLFFGVVPHCCEPCMINALSIPLAIALYFWHNQDVNKFAGHNLILDPYTCVYRLSILSSRVQQTFGRVFTCPAVDIRTTKLY